MTGTDPVGTTADSPDAAPLLELRDLRKEFRIEHGLLGRAKGALRAVDGVSVTVHPGETVGLVGESGSGKSTLARVALRLEQPTSGTIEFAGHDITKLRGAALRDVRREMQMVFQDPYSSLAPLSTVAGSITEPLHAHRVGKRGDREDRVVDLLQLVGLSPDLRNRYPLEFSGGQLQRVAIARALALEPRLIFLDEAVSSLDVSTKAQVINLLADLQARLGLAYLFISHDLSTVRHMSDRIAVMYLGRLVEIGEAAAVYEQPKHPYTEALLSAIPVPDPVVQRSRRRIVLTGDVPSPASPPPGCRFHTRCPYVMDVCRSVDPEPYRTADGTTVFCHLHTAGPKLEGRSVTELSAPATP